MPDGQNNEQISLAEITLPAENLTKTLRFFIDELGFQMDSIAPADDPVIAQLSGYGLNLCLDQNHTGDSGVLCLRTVENTNQTSLVAPNGTRIDFKPAIPALHLPTLKPSLVIQRLNSDDTWKIGRAGMQYRDLIPGRQGGRFIASHIRIPEGGPVPDNVHYHNIQFQMIYCYRGWVRLVYEDQGEAFVMQAGDCVLQPPLIRHRVLESSDGLEVIEIGSPAEHMTYLDHKMHLPTGLDEPTRDYNGQRYTFYQAKQAVYKPMLKGLFEESDLGIAAATNGLVSASVLRVNSKEHCSGEARDHDKALVFRFVLTGQLKLTTQLDHGVALQEIELEAGDSFVIPADLSYAFVAVSSDLEILEIIVDK